MAKIKVVLVLPSTTMNYKNCMQMIEMVSAKSGNFGKSANNQGNGFCLKNVREKSRNSANPRDYQRNIKENVGLCSFNQSIS